MTRDPYNCQHGVRWHLACLYCRIDTEKTEKRRHSKRLASVLLDDHRDDVAEYSLRRVNAALALTGDICRRLT